MAAVDNSHGQALNEAVAAELRAYRAAADMSMEQVAAASGLSKSKIITLEKARVDIGTRDVAILAGVLSFEVPELYRRAQERLSRS